MSASTDQAAAIENKLGKKSIVVLGFLAADQRARLARVWILLALLMLGVAPSVSAINAASVPNVAYNRIGATDDMYVFSRPLARCASPRMMRYSVSRATSAFFAIAECVMPCFKQAASIAALMG